MLDGKFLVDSMLGRLAKWLRILGYDAEYYNDNKNRRGIIYRSLQQKRIVLTRDHRLSKKRAYKLICIQSNFFEDHLKQLEKELDLKFDKNKLFRRCSICNVLLEKIDKKEILNKVPPYIYSTHNEFSRCPKCNRIYWAGSHLELLEEKLRMLNSRGFSNERV